jgi:hypothetical protein
VGGEEVVAEVFLEHFSPAATQAIYWDSLRYKTRADFCDRCFLRNPVALLTIFLALLQEVW